MWWSKSRKSHEMERLKVKEPQICTQVNVLSYITK